MATKKARASTDPSVPVQPTKAPRPFVDPAAVEPILPDSQATAAQVQKQYTAPATLSKSNALGATPTDTNLNLQTFTLNSLAQYTKEKTFSTNASKDVHLFYVGVDDVHSILVYILSRVTISLHLNMFGFDDPELNNILMQKALDPTVSMFITLDKSQAGGVHEKALLDADAKYNLASFNTHWVVGQSATHQISHTKGFVADGRVAAEGSTNWSSSGEGTFVVQGQPGGPNYKAQNNTQSVITDLDTIIRFQTELMNEHATAISQQRPVVAGRAHPIPDKPTPATQALQDSAAAKRGIPTAPAKKPAAKKAPTKKSPAKKPATKKSAAKNAAYPL